MGLEFVIGDHFRFHPEAVEHILYGINHHGRTAKVIFNFRGVIVFAEVLIMYTLVDKTGHSFPVVLRLGMGEGNME